MPRIDEIIDESQAFNDRVASLNIDGVDRQRLLAGWISSLQQDWAESQGLACAIQYRDILLMDVYTEFFTKKQYTTDLKTLFEQDLASIKAIAATLQPQVPKNSVSGADLSERITESEAFLTKCKKLDFGHTVGSNDPASEILKEAWRDAVKDIILLHQGYGFPYVDFSERLLRTYASIYEDETIRGKMDPDKINEYVAEDMVSITALASTIQSKVPENTVSGGVLTRSILEIMNGGGSPHR